MISNEILRSRQDTSRMRAQRPAQPITAGLLRERLVGTGQASTETERPVGTGTRGRFSGSRTVHYRAELSLNFGSEARPKLYRLSIEVPTLQDVTGISRAVSVYFLNTVLRARSNGGSDEVR